MEARKDPRCYGTGLGVIILDDVYLAFRAIQREVDTPTVSWSTLLYCAHSVAVHRDHYGHV
jgi:hypothetical protein